jgi:hypothetical protein
MSISSFFDQVLNLQKQRHEHRQHGYVELLAAVAGGEQPSPKDVETMLDSLGKSVDEFRADVEKYRIRLHLRAAVDALPDVERELEDVASKIRDADKELELAESLHAEKVAPLYARQGELLNARGAASDAKRELFATCEDGDLGARLAEISMELERLNESYRDLASQASYYRTKADNTRLQANRELKAEDRDQRLVQVVRFDKQAKSLEDQIKASDSQRAKLLEQREEIENRMRAW